MSEEEIVEEVEEVYEEVEEVEEIVEEQDVEQQEDEDPEDLYDRATDATSEDEKIKLFRECISKEETTGKGKWGFLSLVEMIKIAFGHSDWQTVSDQFKQLLTYLKSSVNRTETDREFGKLFDLFSSQLDEQIYVNLLTVCLLFYSVSLCMSCILLIHILSVDCTGTV